MIGFVIEGADRLVVGFEKYRKEASKAVRDAVEQTSIAVTSDAKHRLNGQLGSRRHWITGHLAASIYNRVSKDGREKHVGTNVEYAPYIEFGTGDFVDIPEGAGEVAAQYKGTRKVKGFRGDSFLNWAAVNQGKKFIDRVVKNLNAIRT